MYTIILIGILITFFIANMKRRTKMNWNKAIKIIREAIENDNPVRIIYHRKWMKQDCHSDTVDKIISYEWKGKNATAISTYHNVVDPYSYIIDEVKVGE